MFVAALFFVAASARADFASECLAGWPPDSTALRIQRDVVPVIPAIEAALGSQDGTVWQCQDQFDVGVAPGAQDLAAAASRIETLIVSQLGASEASWLEPYLDIQSVPYSKADLYQAQDAISALMPHEPTPLAWSGAVQPEPYPVLTLVLANDRTAADVSAAQQLVTQYGGMVTLTLSDSGPLIFYADPGPAVPPPAPTPPPASTQVPSPSLLPPASAPVLNIVRYNHRLLRARITLAPGSTPLHNVVVSVISRSHRLLARETLARLGTSTSVTLHLKASAHHLTVNVHARTTTGSTVILHSVA